MKTLIDLIAGLVAMLAAAALSQIGIDLHKPTAPIEVQRVSTSEPVQAPVSSSDQKQAN